MRAWRSVVGALGAHAQTLLHCSTHDRGHCWMMVLITWRACYRVCAGPPAAPPCCAAVGHSVRARVLAASCTVACTGLQASRSQPAANAVNRCQLARQAGGIDVPPLLTTWGPPPPPPGTQTHSPRHLQAAGVPVPVAVRCAEMLGSSMLQRLVRAQQHASALAVRPAAAAASAGHQRSLAAAHAGSLQRQQQRSWPSAARRSCATHAAPRLAVMCAGPEGVRWCSNCSCVPHCRCRCSVGGRCSPPCMQVMTLWSWRSRWRA